MTWPIPFIVRREAQLHSSPGEGKPTPQRETPSHVREWLSLKRQVMISVGEGVGKLEAPAGGM